MAEEYLRQTPLAHLHLDANTAEAKASVTLQEIPYRTLISLRGDPDDPAFCKAVKKITGKTPPTAPMTAVTNGEITTLWLGPDEWLVTAPPSARDLTKKLSQALKALHAGVTDISESMTMLSLSGPPARNILAKGCTIDLHPRAFQPGHCTRALLAKTGITLHQTNDIPEYEIYVLRSFSDYTWHWLHQAGLEYGLA